MEFLKIKFNDRHDIIKNFFSKNNSLLCLEKNETINEQAKLQFVENFIDSLVEKRILTTEILNSVDDLNAWSIDFPSWHGNFDEKIGKKILIVGSEPHIHHKYLQTVYGLNGEKEVDHYLDEEKSHPIFRFISELVSHKFNISKEAAIKECYLTDLFPLSPYRGNGKSVGSPEKLQKILGKSGNWAKLRYNYALQNFMYEIREVKPQIIITQGKDVFTEVVKILDITEPPQRIAIVPSSGKRQFLRTVKWNDLTIISVPHIGSQRMRTFWNKNIDLVKDAISDL